MRKLCAGRIPTPEANLWHVFTMFADVLFVLDELRRKGLQKRIRISLEAGDSANRVHRKLKTIHVIKYNHVKRRCRRTFLFVTTNVEILMVCSAVGQPMNQPRISV